MSDKIANIPEYEHDFSGVLKSILSKVNLKLGVVMFLFGFILFSNFTVDKFISKFDNAVENDCVNTKGAIIQLILFVMALLLFDVLIKVDVM